MGQLRKKWQVIWYDYNLTRPRVCKFYTELGAAIYAAYLEAYEDVNNPKIKKIA